VKDETTETSGRTTRETSYAGLDDEGDDPKAGAHDGGEVVDARSKAAHIRGLRATCRRTASCSLAF
jgi:hypothetical protein